MTQKSSGGWSLRKALVRRIAVAVNEYEKEANRPVQGAPTLAPAQPTGAQPLAEAAAPEAVPAEPSAAAPSAAQGEHTVETQD
jgi:hypothetical protein